MNDEPHTGLGPTRLVATLLLLAGASLAPLATSSHGIPAGLDEHRVRGDGGYVAWYLDVDAPDGQADVFLHFGEHLVTQADDANYTYLGLWIVNLDYEYVWTALVATIESDGARVAVNLDDPAKARQVLGLGSDWEGSNGGHLPFPNGEWLVVAYWATDGSVDSRMTLGSELHDGRPSTTLLNASYGDDVFAHDEEAFRGDLNLHAAANGENTCPAPGCGSHRGAHVRAIHNGAVDQTVQHRLFGLFRVPGGETEAHWNGPEGGGQGDRTYWFHGGSPGTYEFVIEENTAIQDNREPAVAVGADVEIPT